MELEKQRKLKNEGKVMASKQSPDEPDVEDEDSDSEEERKAEVEARKMQILKEAQLDLVKDLQEEKLQEERQRVQQKIKQVEQKIANKKMMVPAW